VEKVPVWHAGMYRHKNTAVVKHITDGSHTVSFIIVTYANCITLEVYHSRITPGDDEITTMLKKVAGETVEPLTKILSTMASYK